MVKKRASRNTNDAQEVSLPKRSKIKDEKITKKQNTSLKGNKRKVSSTAHSKSKKKLQSMCKEITPNASIIEENSPSPSKLNKHEDRKPKGQNKQSTTKQKDANDLMKKRKASTSNPSPRTKKQKEDIDNSNNTSPKKQHVSHKSSPIKNYNATPIETVNDLDLDLSKDFKQDDCDSGEESEEVEWEDVQEDEGHHDNSKALSTPSTAKSEDKNVEISIEILGMKGKKRKKVQEDLMTKIKKAMTKFQKEIQLEKHKVHLLMLISVGLHRNAVCNQMYFQAFCLSSVPVQFATKSINKWKAGDLTEFLTWFKEEFPSLEKLNFNLLKYAVISTDRLPRCLAEVLLAILRSLGFLARLVFSLQPVPMKTSQSKQSKKPSPRNNNQNKKKGKMETTPSSSNQTPNSENTASPYFPSGGKGKTPKTPSTSRGKKTPDTSSKDSKLRKQPNARKLRKKKKVNYFVNETSGRSDGEESEYEEETELTSSDEDEHFEKQKKLNLKTPRSTQKEKSVSSKSPSVVDLLDDDDDFEVTSKPVIKAKTALGTPDQPVKILSDDSDSDIDTSITHCKDFWVEVYLPSKKCWSCIDVVSYSIDKPELCEDNIRQPVTYVLGFDNENKIKDITGRYATDWLSKTQKMRIDVDWWEETLLPFKTKKKKMDENEDSLLLEKHQEKPLPQSITEYKNHPLYVLKRHLLKFEAIYPETAATLGFIRGEAVYSRDCLHLLHTREKWMSLEARVVKQGELPYKIVKGRVKRNQPNVDPNSVTIDLFGRWQTEDYKPPPAKDGKVPRNEYGNVELFKPSMLPPGTKHIQIPGIQKIAKKLGIDGAPAVVGFDFHCGFCHPIIDGLVVCKEHVSTLMDAWRQEQQEAKRRKEEKREKRVLGNWKLLVKSMLIRERLKKKYTSENKESTTSSEQGEILEEEKVTEAVAWPQNMKEGKTSVADKGHCHVFPKKLHKKDKITGEWTKACSCGLTLPLK